MFQKTSTEKTSVDVDGKETIVTTETEVGMAQKMRSLVDTYISEKTGIIATKSATYEKLSEDILTLSEIAFIYNISGFMAISPKNFVIPILSNICCICFESA